MKKHNILKVVLISILFVLLCSWIFPTTYYQYELIELSREQLGLFNLFSYPLVALGYFSHTLFYVLVCGGLYGVLAKIPAYKVLLEKIAKGFRGKEHIFLILVMVILSLISSFVGFSFGLIIVFPLIISLVLMLGYNKLIAASVTVGSVICGMIGTTYAADTMSFIHTILGTTATSDMLYKGIIFVLALGLLVFNVLRYAKKVQGKKEGDKQEFIPETMKVEKDKKVRTLPLIIVFDLMLLVLLLGVFPWASVFPKFDWFTNAVAWIQDWELFGFPIFSKILGSVQVFGEWTFSIGSVVIAAFPVVVCFATILLALIYRVKLDDFLDGVIAGMKKSLKPAVIMMMIYLILIISTYHPVQLLFVKVLLGLGKGLNVVVMSVIAFISSFFNVDSMYAVQSTLPYVTSVITDHALYPVIAIIFQAIYGLAMLVLPSSVILMGTLSYLDISYGKWLKHIWKLFIEILIVLIIIFIVMMAL